MNQIYYLRQINDNDIEKMIESLPFDVIGK